MGYFDSVLEHIKRASEYVIFGECKLFEDNGGLRRLEANGMSVPLLVKSSPDMVDGHWGFYAKMTPEDSGDFVYLYDVNSDNSLYAHRFAKEPGALDALVQVFEDAQKVQLIRHEYKTSELSVYSVLFTEGNLPTRLAVKAPLSSKDGYAFVFFEDGDYEADSLFVVKHGDTFEMHKEALLSLDVAREGVGIEDKFLEEMRSMIDLYASLNAA